MFHYQRGFKMKTTSSRRYLSLFSVIFICFTTACVVQPDTPNNGSSQPAQGVYDVAINPGSSYHQNFDYPVSLPGFLLFQGQDIGGIFRAYIFDGQSVKDVLYTGSDYYSGFAHPIVFNNQIYFEGVDITGTNKIYVFDGNVIKNLQVLPDCDYAVSFEFSTVWQDKLFFEGFSINNQARVYVCNGDEITNVKVMTGSTYSNASYSLTTAGTKLFFIGYDTNGLFYPYQITAQGITNVPTNAGCALLSAEQYSVISLGDILFFKGNLINWRKKVFMINSSGTIINPDWGSSETYLEKFENPIAFDNKVLFGGAYYYDDGMDVWYPDAIYTIDLSGQIQKMNKMPGCDFTNNYAGWVILGDEVVFRGRNYEGETMIYVLNGNNYTNIRKNQNTTYSTGGSSLGVISGTVILG